MRIVLVVDAHEIVSKTINYIGGGMYVPLPSLGRIFEPGSEWLS